MAFETTSEATKLWIKGREFTVARLLGDAYKDQAERYVGGGLVIFRLAPQDYHRFHSPVDGTIGPMSYISGEYYTVNVSNNVLSDYLYVICSCAIRVPCVLATSHQDDTRRLWRKRSKNCTNR